MIGIAAKYIVRACGRRATSARASFATNAVPSTMPAVTLAEPGPPDSLRFVADHPTPACGTGPGDVLVKVSCCAVAYRDILDRQGAFPFMNRPTIPGHEFSGTVVAAAGGGDLSPGDRVASLHWAQRDGWPAPLKGGGGGPVGSFLGLTCDGGYAGYVACHDSAFVKVPDGWAPEQAAPVVSTFGTFWHGAVTKGALRPGESVLVTGASGGVGTAAVQVAQRLGCRVVAVTSTEDKVPYLVDELGLPREQVVVCADGDALHKLVQRVPGMENGIDMAFECVGGPTFSSSLRALTPGGRMVLIGNVSNATCDLPLGYCIVNSVSVIGSDSCSRAEMRELFAFLDANNLRPSVDAVLPLREAGEAHRRVEGRGVCGRLVLKVDDDETWPMEAV